MFWDKYRPKISRTIISALLISFIQIIPSVVFAPSAPAVVCSNPNFTSVTNWQTLLQPNGSGFTESENTSSEFTPNKSQLDMSDYGGAPFAYFSEGTGCNVYFRMRLFDQPDSNDKNGFFNGIWVVGIGKVVNGASKT